MDTVGVGPSSEGIINACLYACSFSLKSKCDVVDKQALSHPSGRLVIRTPLKKL